MNPTIAVDTGTTTLVVTLTVDPANQEALLELLRQNANTVISKLEGWISTSYLASEDRTRVLIYSQWRDLAAVRSMQAHPDMIAYFPRIAALAQLDSFPADVVYSRHA